MRPFISTNLAISADGKISTVGHRPSGWTSDADRARFKTLRAEADALLVGRGTWENDRMTMKGPRQPLRCVVSKSGRFDPAHPMFSTPGGAIHLLATANPTATAPAAATLHHGTLENFLITLSRDLGVERLHCEGGGELIRALAEMDALDEFHLTWAGHTLFGGKTAPTSSGIPGGFLPASLAFELTSFEPMENECFLSYRRKR